MCVGCLEVAKGKVEGKRFWKLFNELFQEGKDPEHMSSLLQTVDSLPEEKQNEYANTALEYSREKTD